MRIENPFHEGELDVQERAGEREEGARNGRVVADHIRGFLRTNVSRGSQGRG